MHYITKNSIDCLNKKLNLPAIGDEQDWEIELADRNRIAEFLAAYETEKLNTEERFALMALIIASYEDLVSFGSPDDALWKIISSKVKNEINLHQSSIEYWSVLNSEDPDDWFGITPLIRSLT